jgi:hypothetical protein
MPGWRHWQVDVPLVSEGEDFAIKAISAIADSFTAETISGIVAVRLCVKFFAITSVRNVKKRMVINVRSLYVGGLWKLNLSHRETGWPPIFYTRAGVAD